LESILTAYDTWLSKEGSNLMDKKKFFNFPRSLRRVLVAISTIEIIVVVLITGGCAKKIYIPPSDKEAKSQIILINKIYSSGFYVEVDGKDAGFLQQELNISLKPGDHKLKVFNQETSLSLLKENQETITHQFDLKVKVGEGDVKEIELSWEDEGYSKTAREHKVEEEKKENPRVRSQPKGGLPM
jgi:hypothetical protein